ncbi:hypothetical protein TTHERM_001306873 (macronuclear) [Tetrahymena thermophila SB210]|uniref:Uncharacterized protein n=1 Tax=Tetrahymena thermophila (strain SB210) TaxID=312017 RepID=W7XFP6_TETTS|nr:hypothetical protein TTHERM_001306873 [Tetrahymena thermophila SB210]EWS71634.1 hypothetical protein TTHERM_001306873 [Tetrahymena thermophila SB210]|eukprot:XP_012655836.1 hypothetical protein TTHERM_001306873 [Tetrahymena thermophila SB210]
MEEEEKKGLSNNYKKNITRMFIKFLSSFDNTSYELVKEEFQVKIPDLKKIIKKYNLTEQFNNFIIRFPRLFFSSDIRDKEDKLSTYFDKINHIYENIFLPKKKKCKNQTITQKSQDCNNQFMSYYGSDN